MYHSLSMSFSLLLYIFLSVSHFISPSRPLYTHPSLVLHRPLYLYPTLSHTGDLDVDVDMYDVLSPGERTPNHSMDFIPGRTSDCRRGTTGTIGSGCSLLTSEEYAANAADRLTTPRASMGALQMGSGLSLSRIGRFPSSRVASIFGNR